MHVVHLNYGVSPGREYRTDMGPYSPSKAPDKNFHLIRCPSGEGKIVTTIEELRAFLSGKTWRYAK